MRGAELEDRGGTSLDFAGFAQEFLRRNAEYQRAYAELGLIAAADPAAPSCREMARPWGLTFPGRSCDPGLACPRVLAGGGGANGSGPVSLQSWQSGRRRRTDPA